MDALSGCWAEMIKGETVSLNASWNTSTTCSANLPHTACLAETGLDYFNSSWENKPEGFGNQSLISVSLRLRTYSNDAVLADSCLTPHPPLPSFTSCLQFHTKLGPFSGPLHILSFLPEMPRLLCNYVIAFFLIIQLKLPSVTCLRGGVGGLSWGQAENACGGYSVLLSVYFLLSSVTS